MAAATVISGRSTPHHSAQLSRDSFPGALALDWANGQAIAPISGTSQQSAVFSTVWDRVVYCSVGGASTVVGCWITVGTDPTAAVAAGSLWIPATAPPVPIYVPAGMKIAAIQGATAGTLTMVPALIKGN